MCVFWGAAIDHGGRNSLSPQPPLQIYLPDCTSSATTTITAAAANSTAATATTTAAASSSTTTTANTNS